MSACCCAELPLIQVGGDDIQPKPRDDQQQVLGEDKNLIPSVDTGHPTLGTSNDPWYGATFASENFAFMYHCNHDYDRIIMGYEAIPNWATTYGRVNIMQSNTESDLAVLSLRQMAPEAPIAVIAGTEEGDQDATISTATGGGIVAPGPKLKGLGSFGWEHSGEMMQVNLNGKKRWLALYKAEGDD